jgi:hypothetical protein
MDAAQNLESEIRKVSDAETVVPDMGEEYIL